MIRIVLAGEPAGTWHLFRQSQWMAKVRESPEAASWPRSHFDIDEEAYQAALGEWEGSGGDLDRAIALLSRLGATEASRN